jgi:hypothetical protein
VLQPAAPSRNGTQAAFLALLTALGSFLQPVLGSKLLLDLDSDGIGTHVQKQELVVSCPLGAVRATPRRWHKLRIALVEGSEFEDEKNVRLNPEMQTANWKQDAFWPPALQSSLKQATSACSCWAGWSFASKSA